MRPGGHLERWLTQAAAGRCPCGRRLAQGRKRLCRRPACRTEYQRLYALDRTLSSLRAVVGLQAVPGAPKQVRLLLGCGHTQDVPMSRAARAQRRHCRVCVPSGPGT